MSLGPQHPAWRQLHDELSKLAQACGGEHAFVLDEGNGLWCVAVAKLSATVATYDQDKTADRFYKAEVVPRASAMRKGKRIQIAVAEGEDCYAAISFAAIYMVVVWFSAPFASTIVLPRISQALPEIERLTLLLPPSGGPGSNEAAAKQRA